MIETADRIFKNTLTEIALKSELYNMTSLRQWEHHLDYTLKSDQVELYHHMGRLVGFSTWYLTNNLYDQTLRNEGKYCIITFICILPEHRKKYNIRDLLLMGVERNAIKLAANDVDLVLWRRPDPDERGNYTSRNRYWLGLKRTQGGWKCTKLLVR